MTASGEKNGMKNMKYETIMNSNSSEKACNGERHHMAASSARRFRRISMAKMAASRI